VEYFVTPLQRVADASAANDVIRSYIGPLMVTLAGLATVVCTFFIVMAGIQYITSKGSPDKLEHAKRVMRNALVGLVIVIAAGTLTAILSNAYGASTGVGVENIPALNTVETSSDNASIVEVLIKAITGLFRHVINTAAKPFISSLEFFTKATPLMASNPSVFKMWLTTVVIADALFMLVVALLGFHMMSAASLGMDEIELKHMVPQLTVTFLLINTSIFIIDMVIGLSNVLIKAMNAAFSSVGVWTALNAVAKGADGLGLVALMIMVVFVTLAVILLVYYVMRLVTLYIGAVLSPLIILLGLLPGFKDFAMTAAKAYLTTIFVLFVHVIILLLAASLFAATAVGGPNGQPNTFMAMIVGIATLVTLLKTQGVMMQMSYVATGPRALRKLGGQFMTGISYTTTKMKTARSMGTTK